MTSWWSTLRIGEWGVQLLLLCFASLVYFGVSQIDPARYAVHLALVSIWSALVLTGGYLINNYCDRLQDRGKENRDPRVQTDPGRVLVIGVACLICAAVILVARSPNGFIVVVGAVQIAGGLAYSVPGPRLKERGVWGVLTAATMQRIPGFLMIALAFPPRAAAAIAITVWFFVLGLIFIVEHQLEDLADDQRAGVSTWAAARGRLQTQHTRFRLHRIFGVVSVTAAAVILWETPTWAGLLSGLLLAGLSALLRFLAWGRYVGNRRLPRTADLPPSSEKDTVVIHGGGLSGLMAAIKLADWGYEAEVREETPAGDHRGEDDSSVHAVRFDPAYLEEYLDCSFGDCFELVHRETLYVNGRPLRRNSPHWVCRRGRAPDTLDGFLRENAWDRGVTFARAGQVRALPESSSGPTILATGLSTESFETLGLDHTLLSGYWAAAPCSRPNVLLTYVGDYAHPSYGYVASGGGTIYALIFSPRGVTPAALEVFTRQLEETEGIAFDAWRTMRGAVPREVCLFRSGYVLAGSLSGMMDPFWYSGVSGALLSGGLAALTLIDPELARKEHRHVTRNFGVQLQLADLATRLPWRWAMIPWIVNGVVDPAGSLGRWCREPRIRERYKPLEPPAVELEHHEVRIGS